MAVKHKIVKAKKGMILKVEKTDKGEKYSKAKSSDLKGLAAKTKYGREVDLQTREAKKRKKK